MFARNEKVHAHIILSTFEDNVVDFELLVECVDCISNTLMLKTPPTLDRVVISLWWGW